MLLQNCKNGIQVFQYSMQLLIAFQQLYSATLLDNPKLQKKVKEIHISRQNKKKQSIAAKLLATIR